MPFFKMNYVKLVCDNCGYTGSIIGYEKEARKDGWLIRKDQTKCYCPKCAPTFRKVGHAYVGLTHFVKRRRYESAANNLPAIAAGQKN